MKKPHRSSAPTTVMIAVLIAAATFVTYWPALGNGSVWDDIPYLLQNRHVQAGMTLAGVKWAFTSLERCNWHPLTWLSTMLDYRLFAHHLWGYHLVNVLFHMANSILLLLLLVRMTGSPWRSGFVAGLFALHPLHVESVAWIAERKDVLSTFFMFLTMLAYLHYVRRPGWIRYSLVGVLFAMGLMAKPMLVTLPIVLLLLDYWPLGRFDQKHSIGTLVREKVPLLVLSMASSAVTYVAQRGSHAIAPYSIGLRIANALVSYVRYIGKMIWPSGLAVHYPFPANGIPAWQPAIASVILIAISVLVFRARKQHPYLLWGWLWYVITLIPVIGIVQVGGQSMADRYTYIPLIGLFVGLAWGIPKLPKAGYALAPMILFVLMICSMLQIGYWKNDLTMFRRVVSVTQGDSMAYNYLGVTLAQKGNMKQAEDCLAKALAIDPFNSSAHLNMGEVLMQKGDKPGARMHFQQALKYDPGNKEALTRMGEID